MKSMIIIGAGIAGLSAGCYAQMNGYKTEIFESHFIPGGCCTAWDRKGYRFDQCIDWLLGTKPGNDINQIWNEVGALKDKRINHFSMFNRVVDTDGQSVSFFTDPDTLEQHLISISPEDEKVIKDFCKDMRLMAKGINFPFLKPAPLMTMKDKIKVFFHLLPYRKMLQKSVTVPINDYVKQFKSPLLQKAFRHILQQEQPNFSLLPYLYNLAAMGEKNAGYPEGGSLPLAQSMEKRFKELGGKLNYMKRIEKILVENDTAVGVRLDDGTEHYGDVVISTADGKTTIYDMLEGKYTGKRTDDIYKGLEENRYQIYDGFSLVFLGVNMDLQGEPCSSTLFLEDPSVIPGLSKEQTSITVRHYCHHEPSFSPHGKSVIQVFFYSDYDYWKELYRDKEKYNAKKEEMGEAVIKILEKQFPKIRKKIEAIDLSTPVTAERYTGNHKGTVMAWVPFYETEEALESYAEEYKMQLPGLKNFYMAGHWISMGGLIRAVSSGRHVIQYVCHNAKKKFHAFTA